MLYISIFEVGIGQDDVGRELGGGCGLARKGKYIVEGVSLPSCKYY